MTLLKQIQKILKNAPEWQKLPLVVPKDLYELAKKNSILGADRLPTSSEIK